MTASFDDSLGTPPLAEAIDHDTHLPALHSVEPNEKPNLKTFLNNLQLQITNLVNYPELPLDDRQAVLRSVLSDLQQFQDSL